VIAQRELRNQSAQILAAVEAGAAFVVTRHGVPVAELRPFTGGRHRLVPRAAIAAAASAGPPIDAPAFRRDLDEAISQHLAP
jgi:prevent-host-death family protein